MVMMMFSTSCISTKVTKEGGQPAENSPKVKVGLFLDRGCRGNGALQWARLLAHCPQLDLMLLDAKDIRNGKLDGLQLLVCPGGGSARQIAAMEPDGVARVKQFIEDGGSYLGICAGSYNAMNREGRLALLPFDYNYAAAGKLADLAIEFNEEGAKLLGIKPGRHIARYNGGNVMKPTEPTDKMSDAQVLAVFKSSVSNYDRKPYNFMDTPAAVFGHYGKGKVIITSFHPESYESTHDIALGCVYAATGIKPIPVYPQKVNRPLRVGWMSLACVGTRAAHEMLSLDKESAFDVDIFTLHEINEGRLRHYDVIVMTNGDEISYKNLMNNDYQKKQLLDYLERGGRVIASGNGGKYLPEHPNIQVLPIGEPFANVLNK